MLNIIFDKFAAEPTPSTTYSPSWQPSQIKGGGGRHNFFSFNSFATSLDNSTHPRTIELAKFGTACDNVIIPAAAAVACFFSLFFLQRLDSLDCNPELSPFHGGSLGLGLFTETLWNRSRVVFGIPATGWRATPHIWYNLQKLLRLCPRFDGVEMAGWRPASG